MRTGGLRVSEQESPRLHAFDHLKAWAIVAVVFTHAGPNTFEASGDPGLWFATKTWTAFHVPSFLFVSGFLNARSGALPPSTLAARLKRLLLPYGVACAFAFALVVPPPSAAEALSRLLTGSVFGVYYYVFVFTLCLLLAAPLSWLSRRSALLLWCVYSVYSVLAALEPALRPSRDIFWVLRNPIQIFTFGFFLSGWLAAQYRSELVDLHDRRPWLLPSLSVAAILLGAAMESGLLPFSLQGLNRVPYTFGVIGLFVLLTRNRPARGPTRFLAEATLGIYLYHIFFITWLLPVADAWEAWPRLAALVGAGLGGAVAVTGGARTLLGAPRARRWIGA